MTAIAPEKTKLEEIPDVIVCLWETLTEADTANAISLANKADKTVTVTGTFGSATVVMKGSNDGANFYTLKDAQGDDISFTAAGMSIILENPLFIKPTFSGGTSQDVDVIIVAKD